MDAKLDCEVDAEGTVDMMDCGDEWLISAKRLRVRVTVTFHKRQGNPMPSYSGTSSCHFLMYFPSSLMGRSTVSRMTLERVAHHCHGRTLSSYSDVAHAPHILGSPFKNSV
jgi:hypothetical protein